MVAITGRSSTDSASRRPQARSQRKASLITTPLRPIPTPHKSPVTVCTPTVPFGGQLFSSSTRPENRSLTSSARSKYTRSATRRIRSRPETRLQEERICRWSRSISHQRSAYAETRAAAESVSASSLRASAAQRINERTSLSTNQ